VNALTPKEGPSILGCASLWACLIVITIDAWSAHARRPVRSLAELRHERVVIQKWDLSCGAAALATLLTYDLSDPVDERTVAEAMLRPNDPLKVRAQGGFSLFDLQQYARSRGYEADGYGKMEMNDLAAMVPAIVPIHTFGQVANMPDILAVADRYGVPVVEDAACALGVTTLRRRCADPHGSAGARGSG